MIVGNTGGPIQRTPQFLAVTSATLSPGPRAGKFNETNHIGIALRLLLRYPVRAMNPKPKALRTSSNP